MNTKHCRNTCCTLTYILQHKYYITNQTGHFISQATSEHWTVSLCWFFQLHYISVMEFGLLLTRSGLTYPKVSSKVCHNSFCQLGNSVSLPWVIYYVAFYLHAVSSFSCIPVVCPELVFFLIPL